MSGNSVGIAIETLRKSTNRLSAENPVARAVARLAEMDPPAKSANEAMRRLGVARATARAAFKQWQEKPT